MYGHPLALTSNLSLVGVKNPFGVTTNHFGDNSLAENTPNASKKFEIFEKSSLWVSVVSVLYPAQIHHFTWKVLNQIS